MAKRRKIEIDNDDGKDDQERKLESMLFGIPYVPQGHEQHSDHNSDGGRPMANLLDSDLFFIDDGHPSSQPTSDDEDTSSPPPIPTNPSKKKKSAWSDPSEDTPTNKISLLLSAAAPSHRRKLRLSQNEDAISEKEYESRLRAQFERINPEPAWAKHARKKNREEHDVDDNDTVHNLFTSTNGILKAAERRKKTSVLLPSGTLSIERLRDANLAAQNDASAGKVNALSFHPNHKLPILCVATADRRIRLYNVDGHTSPLLQTLHTPSLPLTSPTSALFHPSGSSLLLSGPRPFFFTHDLQTGLTTQHDRGLWGTTFSHTTTSLDTHKRSRNDKSSHASLIHLTSFSPMGDMLAVAAGTGAQVHLVDWKSGAGQVIDSFKCTGAGGGGGGSVQGLWWLNDSATGGDNNRHHLAVLTSDAEVYLWDIGQRRCVRRWKDEGGGFRNAGRVLAGTQAGGNGGYLGIGSSSGFVNIYPSTSFSPHPDAKPPKPIKTIGNLTTAITALKFNHDAQLLAIASKEKKDAMRLIHLPTLAAFANWPTSSTPLGRVTAVEFSRGSEYVVVGNERGRVLVYHLREYGAGLG